MINTKIFELSSQKIISNRKLEGELSNEVNSTDSFINETDIPLEENNIIEPKSPFFYLTGYYLVFLMMSVYVIALINRSRLHPQMKEHLKSGILKFLYMANNGALLVSIIFISSLYEIMGFAPIALGIIILSIGSIYYLCNLEDNWVVIFFNNNQVEELCRLPGLMIKLVRHTFECCRCEYYDVTFITKYSDGRVEKETWCTSLICLVWNFFCLILKIMSTFFTIISYYIFLALFLLIRMIAKVIYYRCCIKEEEPSPDNGGNVENNQEVKVNNGDDNDNEKDINVGPSNGEPKVIQFNPDNYYNNNYQNSNNNILNNQQINNNYQYRRNCFLNNQQFYNNYQYPNNGFLNNEQFYNYGQPQNDTSRIPIRGRSINISQNMINNGNIQNFNENARNNQNSNVMNLNKNKKTPDENRNNNKKNVINYPGIKDIQTNNDYTPEKEITNNRINTQNNPVHNDIHINKTIYDTLSFNQENDVNDVNKLGLNNEKDINNNNILSININNENKQNKQNKQNNLELNNNDIDNKKISDEDIKDDKENEPAPTIVGNNLNNQSSDDKNMQKNNDNESEDMDYDIEMNNNINYKL